MSYHGANSIFLSVCLLIGAFFLYNNFTTCHLYACVFYARLLYDDDDVGPAMKFCRQLIHGTT